MLKEARSAKQFRKGTDVEIFRWNVDKFYEDMWDKIYSTLTSGADDSVDMSKGYLNLYNFDDVGSAPMKWQRKGFDEICVWQANKEDLKFVEALAKKFHLDYEYKVDKNVEKTPYAIVVYIPQYSNVDDYIQYEPKTYQTVFSKKAADALQAEVAATVASDYDDTVDTNLTYIANKG